MLVSEFESINRDILLDPVQPNELLNACTDGTVFFLVTTSRSKKPVKDRPVLYARFVMPIWFSETEKYVEFLGITDSRNLITKVIRPDGIDETKGSHILYRVKPMQPDDPRRGQNWHDWPVR